MKRGFLISIAICMVLCLAACSSGNDKDVSFSSDQKPQEITVAAETDDSAGESEVPQSIPEQETDMVIEATWDEVTENQTETEAGQMLKIEIGNQVLYAVLKQILLRRH